MSGFKEGELIISSAPYAYVLNNECRGLCCDYCFRENEKLKRCVACGFVYYCDQSCQRRAWEMHKTECEFLRGRALPHQRIRLMILVLMKIRKRGYEEPSEEFSDRRASMASLMSHTEDFKKKWYNDIMQIKKEVEFYIGSGYVPPLDEFVEIYGKIETNVFFIQSYIVKSGKGLGLYLGPSFFDHSCDADAAWTFDGTTLNVRMMRSVSHRDISRVHISYYNTISLKEERTTHFSENYFFVCSCAICTSPNSDELLMKLVSDTPEARENAMKFKEEVEDLLSNSPSLDDPQLLYAECKKLLESQSGVLADTNIYRIRTLKKAFQVCLKLKKFEEAAKFASQLEKPYRIYFNVNHPALGNFLFEYALTLFFLKRYQEALPIFSEALTKLKVTQGEHHLKELAIKKLIQICLKH